MGPDTKNVLIEAAIFDTISIARTARRHKLPSEASRRFERGVDPAISFVAARRVADLMVELAGGTLDGAGGALFTEWVRSASETPDRLRAGSDRRRLHGLPRSSARCVTIGCGRDDLDDGLVGHPAVWRPRPHRQVDARRGGRPNRGLRPHPVGPSHSAVRPRAHRGHEQGRRRVADALAAAGSSRHRRSPSPPRRRTICTVRHRADGCRACRLANPLDGQTPFLRRSA